jgi:MFS family permease
MFWRLTFAMSIRGLGSFVLPFLAYYLAAAVHLGATDISVVVAAFGAGWTVGDPAGGYLADRLGRRRVIVVSNLAAAITFASLAYAHSMPALTASSAAIGLTFDAWRPAAQALLAETTAGQPQQRKQAMTLFFWAMNASAGIASLAGGWIAIEAGWKWLFLGNAAAAVAFAFATWVLVPATPSTKAEPAPSRPAVTRRLRHMPLFDPLLLVFTFLTLIWFTIYSQTLYGLPVRFAGDGIAPVGFGFIAAVNPLTIGVLQLALQRWIGGYQDNDGRRSSRVLPAVWACTIGLAVTGLGVAVTGAGSGLRWYLGASVIVTLGEILFLSPATAFVADFAPPGRAGSYLGVWGSTAGLSTLAAASAGGAIVAAGGLRLLWWVCGVAGVAAACACTPLAPWEARRHRIAERAAAAFAAPPLPEPGLRPEPVPAIGEGGKS